MNPDAAFKFLADNLTDWSRVTALTLVRPGARFELIPVEAGGGTSIVGQYHTEREFWLHPKLLAFTILSIVLGLTINAMIPERKAGPGLFESVVLIVIYWFAYASVVHFACILIGGSGRYLETLSVTIQVLASLYVVTSFISFFAATVLSLPQLSPWIRSIPGVGHRLVEEPVFVFFLIAPIMTAVYLPLAMRSVHKFGWVRTAIISFGLLLPAWTIWLGASVYQSTGLLMAPPMRR